MANDACDLVKNEYVGDGTTKLFSFTLNMTNKMRFMSLFVIQQLNILHLLIATGLPL